MLRNGYKEHSKPNVKTEPSDLTSEVVDQQIVIKEERGMGMDETDRKQNDVERKGNYHQCQICQKTFGSLSAIWIHYVSSHFSKNLKENYATSMDFENLKLRGAH